MNESDLNELTFKLKKFDLSEIKDYKSIHIIGKRAVGKTTLANDIINQRYSSNNFLFSQMETIKNEYNNIPKKNIFDEYTDNIRDNEIFNSNSSTLIFEDDHRPNDFQDNIIFQSLIMNSRHLRTNIILISQYSFLNPTIRSNMDYVFLFRETNLTNKKKLYEHYGSIFPSYDVFELIFDQVTKNYGCLVINNASRSSYIEDNVFWYKALPTLFPIVDNYENKLENCSLSEVENPNLAEQLENPNLSEQFEDPISKKEHEININSGNCICSYNIINWFFSWF